MREKKAQTKEIDVKSMIKDAKSQLINQNRLQTHGTLGNNVRKTQPNDSDGKKTPSKLKKHGSKKWYEKAIEQHKEQWKKKLMEFHTRI